MTLPLSHLGGKVRRDELGIFTENAWLLLSPGWCFVRAIWNLSSYNISPSHSPLCRLHTLSHHLPDVQSFWEPQRPSAVVTELGGARKEFLLLYNLFRFFLIIFLLFLFSCQYFLFLPTDQDKQNTDTVKCVLRLKVCLDAIIYVLAKLCTSLFVPIISIFSTGKCRNPQNRWRKRPFVHLLNLWKEEYLHI